MIEVKFDKKIINQYIERIPYSHSISSDIDATAGKEIRKIITNMVMDVMFILGKIEGKMEILQKQAGIL
jgi:hypothetical protein